MKAILTSLMILMVTIGFSQSKPYTYVDAAGNTFYLNSGSLKYTPTTAATNNGIYTAAATKTVTLNKADATALETLFTNAIAKTNEQVATKVVGVGIIKWKEGTTAKKVFMTATSATKTTLEKKITEIISK